MENEEIKQTAESGGSPLNDGLDGDWSFHVYCMEQATNSRTLFYCRIGSNTVWGFEPANGKRGVAITDGHGQVVVNIDNLREMLTLLTVAA